MILLYPYLCNGANMIKRLTCIKGHHSVLGLSFFQIKLARKNQDKLETRKRERDEMSKRNTVFEEEEELNLELRPLPDDEV